VLPILHLNGYKIANPTVLARIPERELVSLFEGCGWRPMLVRSELDEPPAHAHQRFAAALDEALDDIRTFQEAARDGRGTTRPQWPMIVLRARRERSGFARVRPDGDGWELRTRDGRVTRFDAAERPLAVVDPFGNSIDYVWSEGALVETLAPMGVFVGGNWPDRNGTAQRPDPLLPLLDTDDRVTKGRYLLQACCAQPGVRHLQEARIRGNQPVVDLIARLRDELVRPVTYALADPATADQNRLMNAAKDSTSPAGPSRGALRLASIPAAITPGIRVSRAMKVIQMTTDSVPWWAATLAAIMVLESAVL